MRALILTARTGGGHAACADALRSALYDQVGCQAAVDIADLWTDEAPWPLDQAPRLYRPLVTRAPRLWRAIYSVGEHPRLMRQVLSLVWAWTRSRARAALARYRPTAVIAVHPLLQDVVLRVTDEWRRRDGVAVPFFTVVADLVSVPRPWFHPASSLCFVPTEQALQLALRSGLRPDQVRCHGLPVRRQFGSCQLAKEAARTQLGLEPGLPLVLALGGGEGMGDVVPIVECLAARLACQGQNRPPRAQLGVLCGRNVRMRSELAARTWPLSVKVEGYVSNPWDWMAASDFVITKAGPNTITEAFAVGVPLLISSFVPGQEEGNVRYVVDSGAGAYAARPEEIASVASFWLGPGRDRLEVMARAARRLGRPSAAHDIASDIFSYAAT